MRTDGPRTLRSYDFSFLSPATRETNTRWRVDVRGRLLKRS